MTEDAIITIAICAMIAVVAYSVSSCLKTAPGMSNAPHLECIKARGEWRTDWWGSRCVFPEQKKQQ